jgi:hypothetical protein
MDVTTVNRANSILKIGSELGVITDLVWDMVGVIRRVYMISVEQGRHENGQHLAEISTIRCAH